MHAQVAHARGDLGGLDEFSHGFDAQLVANLHQRANQCARADVAQDVTDEFAVDLDPVYFQILQVHQRGHACTEVVECDARADLAHARDESAACSEIANRRRLGQFEVQ